MDRRPAGGAAVGETPDIFVDRHCKVLKAYLREIGISASAEAKEDQALP